MPFGWEGDWEGKGTVITMASPVRLTGLSSGLNTDTIIKDLMKVEQLKVDRQFRQKASLEWKKEAYTDVNSQLRTFREKYFSVLNSSSNMTSSNTYNANKVTLSDNTALSVSAGSTAFAKSLSVDSVTMATSATIQSDKGLSRRAMLASSGAVAETSAGITADSTLADLATAQSKTAADSYSFTLNGKSFTFDKTTTINNMIAQVNADTDAKVTMSFDKTAVTFAIVSDVTGTGTTVSASNPVGVAEADAFFGANGLSKIAEGSTSAYAQVKRTDTLATAATKMGKSLTLNTDGKFAVTVAGKEFTFATTATVNDMTNAINNASLGVKINYSEISDQFTLSSTTMGSSSSINISGFESMGVSTTSATGTDATIKFTNGDTVTQSSNTFTLDGLTFTVKGNYSGATPITGTISKDTDALVEKIKSFVTDYNKLIESFNDKLEEKKDYDYYPLTDSEKEEMTEDEVKKWEEKAKKGTLSNDPGLTSLISGLRASLYDVVESTGLKPADLGIKTATWNASGELQKGQLTFDSTSESKLRAAIESDPDKVIAAFSNRSTSTDAATSYKESGLFVRMSNRLNSYISTTASGVIKSTTTAINSADTKLTEMKDKLSDKESAYYKKFSKLESAMSTMNSQSSWFSSQMSAMS